MLCALSGTPTTNPVVSPRSGRIFDRVLLTNYLSTSQTDPVTDEPLTIEELIPLNVEPTTTPSLAPEVSLSIPSMLSAFHNEWNALALQTFTLKKQLNAARKELSNALYYSDASMRVAARAVRERDEARAALAQLAATSGASAVASAPSSALALALALVVTDSRAGEITDAIENSRAALFVAHKSTKRSLPFSADHIISIDNVHSTATPFSIMKHFGVNGTIYITDGTSVARYDTKSTPEVIQLPETDSETPISGFAFSGKSPIIARGTSVTVEKSQFPHLHNDDISKIVVHPDLDDVFVMMSQTKWSLNSVTDLKPVLSVDIDPEMGEATECSVHVDGALVAIGTSSGYILLYDIASGTLASTVFVRNQKVERLQFGENGYWLLVTSVDGEFPNGVCVVDLRKSLIINTIDEDDVLEFIMDNTCSVIFGVTNEAVKIYRYTKKTKSWLKVQDVKDISGDKIDFLHDSMVIMGDEIKEYTMV